jgi:hypothetical protein
MIAPKTPMAPDDRDDDAPRSRTGVVVAMVVLLGAVSLACVGAFALYGKVMSESEVAVGKLATPEEARAQREAAEREFHTLTSAGHLAKAREHLNCGYDPRTRTGGDARNVARHLEAIPEGAPERAEAARIYAELAERQRRAVEVARGVWSRGGDVVRGTLRDELEDGLDEEEREELRLTVARKVDELSGTGIGCVHAVGERHAVFQFEGGACNAELLDRIVPQDTREGLRRAGFRRAQCAPGAVGFDL